MGKRDEVLLWTARYGSVDVDVYSSVEEAYGVAWGMESDGNGTYVGVESEHGVLPREEYDRYCERRNREVQERVSRPRPQYAVHVTHRDGTMVAVYDFDRTKKGAERVVEGLPVWVRSRATVVRLGS